MNVTLDRGLESDARRTFHPEPRRVIGPPAAAEAMVFTVARGRTDMAWVRSEYAGELAVLSVWANVLLPWSISIASLQEGVSFVVVRFQFFLVQVILGADLGRAERPFLLVPAAREFPTSTVVREAYTVWLVAAVIFGLLVLLSIAYYAAEDRVEAAPIDPVRTTGVGLLVVALLLSYASWLLWNGFVGTSVPIGVLFLYVFGGLLLTVERT